jgi:phospholipase/carboxylesterase
VALLEQSAMPQPELGFVHRFIPGHAADRAPLLLLHGSGGDENDLLPLADRIAPGHTLLSPRGKVDEHGITRFFRREPNGAWDLDDLERRTGDLAEFLERARHAYRLPAPIALGYSNGANIGWSLLVRKSGSLAGAILFRAMLPFEFGPMPDLRGVPVLLIAGTADELIPLDRAGLLAAKLGEAGADVSYEVLHTGHGLTAEDLSLAAAWLAARR